MKKTIQIQDGLVFICGPSASGKTTLARKIFDEAPYSHKTLVSFDKILVEFLVDHNLPGKYFYTKLPGDLDEKFKTNVILALQKALTSKDFVIYEGIHCDPEKLGTIIDFLPFLGLNRPLTLIKLFLPMELQLAFLQTRFGSATINDIDDRDRLKSQRADIARMKEPNHFSKNREWIKEYTIDDPRELRFNFKKSHELSRELLAAHEYFEQFSEATSK